MDPDGYGKGSGTFCGWRASGGRACRPCPRGLIEFCLDAWTPSLPRGAAFRILDGGALHGTSTNFFREAARRPMLL